MQQVDVEGSEAVAAVVTVDVLEWVDGEPTVVLVSDPSGITTEDLHRIRLGAIRAARGVEPVEREPLTRPRKRKGLDDQFYRDVAVAYRDAVARHERPRVVIARESGTPMGTVSRWVKEARKRGFLPPAQPGRVSA